MVDRRADLTQGYLRAAILELLRSRSLEQITVKELAEKLKTLKLT